MKDQSKSSFIFELIEEFEIFDKSGNPNEFTDEAYNLFCEKYQTKTATRDSELLNYLNQTPNMFRSHIPHSRYAFSVVLNVVWYYDELIINDPVLELIKSEGTLERKKIALRETLSFLKDIKESILGGYILFAGENLVPSNTGQYADESSILLQQQEVALEFEKISAFLTRLSEVNDPPEDNYTQLEVLYNGLKGNVRQIGNFIPDQLKQNPEKLGNSVIYDFVSPKNRVDRQEFTQFNKQDMLKSLDAEYIKDISTVLEAMANAEQLNSPVLFYREVDKIVAQEYTSLSHVSQTNEAVYKYSAPYFEKINPLRLFDVREEIPNAFMDFRSLLFNLVKEAMQKTNDPTEIRYIIATKLNPLKRTLETEMENAKRTFLIKGILGTTGLLTGSLALFGGVDYSQIVGAAFGTGGLATTGIAYNSKLTHQNNAKLNPLYFLWKAQRDK